MIRISLEQVSVYGRGAQGVRVISVKDDTKVSAVSVIEPEPEEPIDAVSDTDNISADEDDEEVKPSAGNEDTDI
jgi:Type IIA topoisomerase (DNA gyrase/topo II, topoisomerase IV), A subunit